MVPVRLEGRRRERLLVVGGGMAALKLVEELVEQCPGRYEIVLAAKEQHPPYNRVLLSSLLAGEAQEADIELRPAAWYAREGHHAARRRRSVAACGRRGSEVVLAERRAARLRPARAGDRLQGHPAAGARPRRSRAFSPSAISTMWSVLQRRCAGIARRRDRRRAARRRGRVRARQARARGHAHPHHAAPDGASARCPRRRAAQGGGREQRRRGRAGGADRGHRRRWQGRARGA